MILQSDESKLITLHWIFSVPYGQTVLRATGTIVHTISQDYLLFKRQHVSKEKKSVKNVNFNHMWFWRTVFYWTTVQWVTQKTHTDNSKLHQKKKSQNFLIHQQLNCKQSTNQPVTQRTTLSPWLQFSKLLRCGNIRPCRAFYSVPCRSRTLEFAAREDWMNSLAFLSCESPVLVP